jgi:UDP-N-acetylglucosamine--N-acetylmuramyl-(pentapeptide) pyrophosphoryl-undecaprenol N-acetylglucosamine transferase
VVVFLFGGFLSAGPGLASRLLGIPVALHEANCAPGKATRLLARFAGRIYMPNDQNLKGIPDERIRHLGYPVRREIQKLAVDTARANLGLSVSGRLLVIIGGSQGASALNDWAEDNFEDLAELGISLYCVCGLKQAEAMERSYTNRKGMVCHFTRVQFSDRMGEVISAADLVISRAGAGSIAELTVCRRPSILVPYPFAADNHQAANAEAHTREGAGLLVSQEALAGLTERVRELIFNDSELERMRNALSELDQFNSAEGIADDLLSLAGAKGERREGGSDAV